MGRRGDGERRESGHGNHVQSALHSPLRNDSRRWKREVGRGIGFLEVPASWRREGNSCGPWRRYYVQYLGLVSRWAGASP